MEKQSYPVSKHSFIYAIYISVALIILTLVFYVLDLYAETWPGYISYAVLLAGVVMASIHYRDKRLGGYATYGQSFSSGFMAGLFAAIIMAIFTFFYMTFMGDSMHETLMMNAEEEMLRRTPNMTDEQLEMGMNIAENMMKPWWLSVMAMVAYVIISLVFSLIASIFIKKEQPEATGE